MNWRIKMAVKVYIDGQEGTTGLKILERFEGRNDIELLKIDGEKRKDPAERKGLSIQQILFFSVCRTRLQERRFRLLKTIM